MMWLLFIFLFCFASTKAAILKNPSRIVGGTNTTVEKYPYIVQIERLGAVSQAWSLSCGASILTQNRLLTAAHCLEVTNFTPLNRRIRAGSTLRGEGGTVVNILSRINHPDYTDMNADGSFDSIDHDVAIIYLAEDLIYSDVIQPGAIISQSSRFPAETAVVTAVGWGWNYFQGLLADELMEATINVINQEECQKRYQENDPFQPGIFNSTVTDNMICLGLLDVGGEGICNGDSGGPAVFYGVIFGIVSWTYECADQHYPDVYVRVSSYTNWILANV